MKFNINHLYVFLYGIKPEESVSHNIVFIIFNKFHKNRLVSDCPPFIRSWLIFLIKGVCVSSRSVVSDPLHVHGL